MANCYQCKRPILDGEGRCLHSNGTCGHVMIYTRGGKQYAGCPYIHEKEKQVEPSIDDRFVYHKPDENQVTDIEEVRLACSELFRLITRIDMDGRCRSLAITNLEQVSMWANKGIVFRKSTAVES